MGATVKTIISASFHRNGVGGVGFYAILFEDHENGLMVASLFDEPGYCAVYMVEKLHERDIEFGSNSWRGDRYESDLRPMLKAFLKQNGTNRVGPFAFPTA